MKYLRTKKDINGYSLIELVIYIALFSFVAILLIQSLLYAIRTYAYAQSYRRLQVNGEIVMERLVRDIRESEVIVGSIQNVSDGRIHLRLQDGSTSVERIYQKEGNRIVLVEGGVSTALTASHVDSTSLVFSSYGSGDDQYVRIVFSLMTNGAVQTSATFNSTVMLQP